MSILVYTESENGTFKKNAFEVASFAYDLAQKTGGSVTAICFHADEAESLGKYGVSKVLQVKDDQLKTFNARAYASAIAQAAADTGAKTIVLSSTTDARYLGGILAGELNAGYVPNVVGSPVSTEPLTLNRTVFSNKGFAHTTIKTDNKIIGVSNNAFGVHENPVTADVTEFNVSVSEADLSAKSTDIDKVTDKVAIADAEIVVSGGRGLKGPEHWGMIEELAEVLGAATACSKPVSDMGWRPHSEHVGQTGKPVASNLYIAIGISGAIQHLAGVNSSKVKVVINSDPEAPFFKAADYGVVGDAFEVVPELIEKLKEFKAQNG